MLEGTARHLRSGIAVLALAAVAVGGEASTVAAPIVRGASSLASGQIPPAAPTGGAPGPEAPADGGAKAVPPATAGAPAVADLPGVAPRPAPAPVPALDHAAPAGPAIASPLPPPPALPPLPEPAAPLLVRRTGIDQSQGVMYRDGKPFRFIGLDAPQAATLWSVNWGCGAQLSDAELDGLFSRLPPGTVVGFWATQAMAFNNKTSGQIDFSGIDRVFAAAARHGQLLAPALETQQGYCSDGHFKDQAWYAGGYRQAFDDDGRGLQPLSYWEYVHRIVPRYRGSPALAWWVPVTEPETSRCAPGRKGDECYAALTCPPTAAATLRRFFDEVGGEIRRLDPDHLLSSNTIGGGQCGTQGDEYVLVHQSPALGICEAHAYDGDAAMTSGMADVVRRCRQAGKAFVAGEIGVRAGGTGCATLEARRDRVVALADGLQRAGGSGLLLWEFAPGASGCVWGIAERDPVLSVLGPR